ncbi:MvaI/BcnI family restriction endonuclease [Bacillus cereus group sp. MYBK69-2]|uniref:MvaI/BcnI family restriction endonuclease n=1 Tax=unclassified Bacillus cereus group TaxID=2750818 RepID=UPI003F799DC6
MNLNKLEEILVYIKKQGWITYNNIFITKAIEMLLMEYGVDFQFRKNKIKVVESGRKPPFLNLLFMEPQKEQEWFDLINTYGSANIRGEQALYTSISPKANSRGFYLKVEENSLKIIKTGEIKDKTLCYYDLDDIHDRLISKLNELLILNISNDRDFSTFRLDDAYLYKNILTERFLEVLMDGGVRLELRMRILPSGSIRSHGTVFRIKRDLIDLLYRDTLPMLK